MKIRFEEMTDFGEVLSKLTGEDLMIGLSIGGVYDVTDCRACSERPDVNEYHFFDDDGTPRVVILHGNLFVFSLIMEEDD